MDSSTSNSDTALSPAGDVPLLRHFSPEVREAFACLRETGNPAAADTVLLAIVRDHQPQKPAVAAPLEDQQALIADLGFDSVAITEMVFFIEDLFQVSISNEEILSIRTVGELRAFVRRKLPAHRPPVA
ncbi:hypothetical protein K0B96_03080 [Horticoccus luteus]|uniref:Carrier domain-containing protein n=1 Tax=Horticoccus luteus TaxID=2862869 RepID=A0A8F9TX19_9BACT|nr:phosphopantetheine-binding protein [Horticoccus luteus]QYM79617.1 hypothetical protein K0B96_03080 [Horticoccus luteus]